MKRYYVVHVKLIWGMVLLSFASLLWNGVQFFSQKDNLIEERKNQKEVSYEYKKIEFAHSKVKDSVDCYLCGNNKRSLMGMYRNSDELGIVSVNHWHVENLRTRNRDDAGQLINSSGSVNTITGTGEGGNFFYSSPKYVVLDISELSGDLLLGMFVALDFVWAKAKEDRTVEKAIFVD